MFFVKSILPSDLPPTPKAGAQGAAIPIYWGCTWQQGRIILPTQHRQGMEPPSYNTAQSSYSKHTILISQGNVIESLLQDLNFWSLFVVMTWVWDIIYFPINKENAFLRGRTKPTLPPAKLHQRVCSKKPLCSILVQRHEQGVKGTWMYFP